eukprot:7232116-Pyramimonas_sp.AAC.1
MLDDGEASDTYCNVERWRSQDRAVLIREVRDQQCEWFPDPSPIEIQENAPPFLEFDPSMEDACEYSESKGCKFSFARPFLDGAGERNIQLAQRQ